MFRQIQQTVEKGQVDAILEVFHVQARDEARLTKYLLQKHEDLNFILNTNVTCSGPKEVGSGGSLRLIG